MAERLRAMSLRPDMVNMLESLLYTSRRLAKSGHLPNEWKILGAHFKASTLQ